MAEMSPLGRVLLTILKNGAIASAALLTLFMCIALWQRLSPNGGIELQKGDIGFFVVVGVMVLLALWLVRAIRRELDNPGG